MIASTSSTTNEKEQLMNVSFFRTHALAVAIAVAVLAGCSSGGSSAFAPLAATPINPATAAAQCPSQGYPQSGPRASEIINEFATLPTSQQASDFEIVLCGNWTDQIGTQPLYGPYDPFCPPSNGPSNPCYPTVTYNASTNTTTVSFAGPTLYQNIPSHPGEYHFGLLSTWYDQSLDNMVLAQYWTYASQPPAAQPIVSVNWSPKTLTCSNWRYATVYIAVALTKGGSAVTGQWMQTAYCPGKGTKQPVFTFKNYGKQTVYVVSSGVVLNQSVPTNANCFTNDAACAQDMSILSTLNFAGMPPPGSAGSPFVKLQKPPRSVLKPLKFPV
jgi:hypothetical protein